AILLADTYEMAYSLVRYYTSNLKEADPFKQWEVNGVKLNSIFWLNAHLCWSENYLLLQATGGNPNETKWLEHYGFGSDGTHHALDIDFKEILNTRKVIHEAAMAHLRSLNDEDLMKENAFSIQFSQSKSNKSI